MLFCDADFDAFFKKFTTDSLYQANHVQFPLQLHCFEGTYGDSIYEVSEHVNKYNFSKMLRLPEPNSTIEKSKYYRHISTFTDTVNCEYTSETETHNLYYQFVYKDNCWLLNGIYDDSIYKPDPFRLSKLQIYTQNF